MVAIQLIKTESYMPLRVKLKRGSGGAAVIGFVLGHFQACIF